MNINELKQWAINNDIERRTLNAFWKTMDNYKEENPDEFNEVFGNIDLSKFYLKVNAVSLNLGNWPECSYVTISASLPIYYENKSIGHYKTLYTIDGEEEDDFFDIY